MRGFLIALGIGALLGVVSAALFAPTVIGWYFAPPVEMAYTCKAAVDWGMQTFRMALLWGTGVGTVLGLLAFFFWKTRARKKPEIPAPSAP